MRRSKLLFGVAAGAAAVALAAVSGVAQAGHVGVYISGGVPYYYPVAPVPYYYGPPVMVAPPQPQAPDYIEQGQPVQGEQDPAYAQPGEMAGNQQENSDTWYYCDASKTYYPYVKECTSGWRSVPAQPAPSN